MVDVGQPKPDSRRTAKLLLTPITTTTPRPLLQMKGGETVVTAGETRWSRGIALLR